MREALKVTQNQKTEHVLKKEEIRMRKQKGFSLIELLIVVAIILIIAAIAIPNLMKSKMAANHAAGAANTRTMISSEHTFSTLYFGAQGFFADTLKRLGPPPVGTPADNTAAGLLDIVLGCATMPCAKDNYQYSVVPTGAWPTVTDYTTTATALGPNYGSQDFCASSDGVVRMVIVTAPPTTTLYTVATCTALNPL